MEPVNTLQHLIVYGLHDYTLGGGVGALRKLLNHLMNDTKYLVNRRMQRNLPIELNG